MRFGKWFGSKTADPEPSKASKDVVLYESKLEFNLVKYYNRVLTYPVRLMYEHVDYKLRNIRKYLHKMDYASLIELHKELQNYRDIPQIISPVHRELLDHYLTPFDFGVLNKFYVIDIVRKITIYGERVPDQPITCLIYPNLGEVYLRRPRMWCGEGKSDVKLPYCYEDPDLGVIVYLDDPEHQTEQRVEHLVNLIAEGLEWLEQDRKATLTELKQYIRDLIESHYTKSQNMVKLYEAAFMDNKEQGGNVQ